MTKEQTREQAIRNDERRKCIAEIRSMEDRFRKAGLFGQDALVAAEHLRHVAEMLSKSLTKD